MSAESTGADRAGTAKVIGVRIRESDEVQWAIWTGDDPVEPGQWVRLAGGGEIGRLVVGPDMAVGMDETSSLPRVSAVEDDDLVSDYVVQLPVESAWGRIGHRMGALKSDPTEDATSPESTRYRKLKVDMPALGSRIETDQGSGTGVIIASDVFAGRLSVRLDASSDVVEIQYRSIPPAETDSGSSSDITDDPSA